MEEKKDTFQEDRLRAIKEDLYVGEEHHAGGKGLSDVLIHILLADKTLDIESISASFIQLYKEKEYTISHGGILNVKLFEQNFSPKEHYVYPCLDKDLKFRMLHYGEEDWEEAFYVFPYMNANTGWNISNKEEYNL